MGFAKLTLLTGISGAGKTQALLALLASASDSAGQEAAIVGVITPAVFEDGQKTGIDALLLPQHTTLHLACRRDLAPAIPPGDHGLGWVFDNNVIEAVNQHLASLGDAVRQPQILLVVDELGALEMLHNQGFTAALDLLDAGNYHSALVVVRPSLVEPARQRWPVAAVVEPQQGKGTVPFCLGVAAVVGPDEMKGISPCASRTS